MFDRSQTNGSVAMLEEKEIDWEKCFRRDLNKYGSFFRLAYSSWVYSEPVFLALYKYFVPPLRVLDVGCGYGIDAILLAGLGYELTCIDRNPAMLEIARENASQFQGNFRFQVRFERGDAHDLSQHYGQFDFTYSGGVLEHFYPGEAAKLLKEQQRVADRIVFSMPTKYLSEKDEGFRYPHTYRSVKTLCRNADLWPFRIIGYGNPPQRRMIALKKIMPNVLWQALFQKQFAPSIACFCSARTKTGTI
jgi:SAM-dependent methyltransferase